MEETRVRTGIERFMDKFPYWPKNIQVEKEPEYLGVGAPMVDPTNPHLGINKIYKHR